jgi:integrase
MIPLSRLTPMAIDEWLIKMQQKKLSPATVHQAFRVLREALHQAVIWSLIPRSPAELVKAPRVPAKEMRVWDEEQVRLFLAEAKRSSRYYALYLLAILTGLRRGELLALRWQDVDWIFRRLSVKQTLVRMKREVIVREPKSPKSRRTVALPPVALEELKLLRKRQPGTELIFCQEDGKPIHAHNLTQRDFKGVIERAKVPRIRFHDLRHCHATLLLRQGVNPKVVSEQLGHSRVSLTLDLYSHILPGLQEEATLRLAERLLGK